ncbi:hypothetical protein I6M49_01850 [Shewanella algae]|uniref:hypothetical protein n=1 Tax=Shewanella algae TaxID=38313 RepID=UPI001AAC9E7A|nr:hypothetical protein [Shewanella algae]MBO2652217.1 hypothetical protein [Shewanella algae]
MNRRQRNFIIRWLEFKGVSYLPSGQDELKLTEGIYLKTSIGQAKQLKVDIKKFWEHQAIALDNISWLSPKLERQCNWIWGQLVIEFKQKTKEIYLPPTFSFDTYAFTTKDRYQSIIDFFDYLNVPMAEKLRKVEQLKKNWVENAPQRAKIDWLDIDNKEQCDWIWEHSSKLFDNIFLLAPRDNKEKYHDAILLYDTFLGVFDKDKLKKLKNGWAQQKSRTNQKQKGVISEKSLNKVRKQASKLSITPDELIEKLLLD